jgi:hypothetical protein
MNSQETLAKRKLTVPRNDLNNIDSMAVGEQVLPSPYKQPVICAINPLEKL